MLPRMKQAARAAAEAVGVVAPSLADTQTALEEHQSAMIAAQDAVDRAEENLQGAHDRKADPATVRNADTALATSRQDADHARRALAGAEKRHAKAKEAEGERAKATARAKLRDAMAERGRIAEEIDEHARALAARVREFDQHDAPIRDAMTAGLLQNDALIVMNNGARLVELAIAKAGATRPAGVTDSIASERLSAVDLVSQRNSILGG